MLIFQPLIYLQAHFITFIIFADGITMDAKRKAIFFYQYIFIKTFKKHLLNLPVAGFGGG